MAKSNKKDELPVVEKETEVKSIDVAGELRKLKTLLVDLDSRVQSIEGFRTQPSIEGKIRSIYTDIEDTQGAIGQLRADLTKQNKEFKQAVEEINVKIAKKIVAETASTETPV